MNETEARTVLLVRAFESPATLPWTEADAQAATREAAREAGEAASPEAFVARRSAIAARRIAERDALASSVLRDGRASLGASLAFVALVVAFGIGFASDSIADGDRISLLAPPVLGLLLWNLLVYAGLLLSWLRPARTGIHPLRAWLTDTVQRWIAMPRRAAGPWLRFVRDWAEASRGLQTHRLAALLHGGAVAFAAGALASLYLRGLVFEFRAGWDSTFLTPTAVRDWLALLLGPASALSGLPLPDADELATLRFSQGSGENAARWIHLYAITVAALVVWPRAWLAAAAWRRARRAAADFPLDLRAPYFQRLLRAGSGGLLGCRLLPYSHRPSADAVKRLAQAIEQADGHRVRIDLAEPVAQGEEDDEALLARLVTPGDEMLIVLFTLAATPERETHGRLLHALREVAPQRKVLVVVDPASFARRFAESAPERLAERREAWSRVMREVGCTPVFVDLGADAPVSDDDALATALGAA